MKKQERVDLSDWVIHFVHDRIPQDFSEWYLADSEGEIVNFIPSYFDFDKNPCYISEEMIDEEYPIDEDASAISVLMKILHDGYIRSGWAFRKNRPTIYGPFSAVCFTEMPLGSLIHYARKRNKYVGTYGIALKRNELFGVGGRQVIYGLSTQHIEADSEDPFWGYGLRTLSSKCGIGIEEQYRYVATNLQKDIPIDWTHEREWRWPLKNEDYGVNGLPILLDKDYIIHFSDLIIIVDKKKEKEEILLLLKNMYDAGSSNLGYGYNINLLKKTKVVSVEEIEDNASDISKIKFDDISGTIYSNIPSIKVDKETIKHVEKVWKQAGIIAYEASKRFYSEIMNNHDTGLAGFSNVVTYEQTEITQALLNLGIAKSYADGRYVLYGLPEIQVQSLDVHEAGVKAAAKYMSESLNQLFTFSSRLD